MCEIFHFTFCIESFNPVPIQVESQTVPLNFLVYIPDKLSFSISFCLTFIREITLQHVWCSRWIFFIGNQICQTQL